MIDLFNIATIKTPTIHNSYKHWSLTSLTGSPTMCCLPVSSFPMLSIQPDFYKKLQVPSVKSSASPRLPLFLTSGPVCSLTCALLTLLMMLVLCAALTRIGPESADQFSKPYWWQWQGMIWNWGCYGRSWLHAICIGWWNTTSNKNAHREVRTQLKCKQMESIVACYNPCMPTCRSIKGTSG